MIIRNGFVRNHEDEWVNMDRIDSFYIKGFFPKNDTAYYCIVASIDGQEEEISTDFASQELAQDLLDSAFGYAA